MTDETIDRAAIARLLDVIGGDPDDLDDLLEDYRSGAPELAREIAAAAAAGDINALRIAAHTLKSNAREFGAMRLSLLCEELEHACKAGAVSDAGNAAAAILAEEQAARRALDAIPVDELGR